MKLPIVPRTDDVFAIKPALVQRAARVVADVGDRAEHAVAMRDGELRLAEGDLGESASAEMFERTSTDAAPWTVVAANYKWYARVKAVKTAVETLERAGLKRSD